MKKYIPLLALVGCKDPSKGDLEVLIQTATSNSNGVAKFEDSQTGEKVNIYVLDSQTEQGISGAEVTFIDSNKFESFAITDPEGRYINVQDYFPHNSDHDIMMDSSDMGMTIWDRYFNDNEDTVNALDEYTDWIEQGDLPGYDYIGCKTLEELQQEADYTMVTMKIVAGASGGAAYKFVGTVEELQGYIEDLIEEGVIDYDYSPAFDIYEPRNFTASALLVATDGCEESVDVCTGDELFCDDFNGSALDEGNWEYELGNVSVSEGHLNLEEFAFVQSYRVDLSSNNSNFTMSSPMFVNSEGLYEVSMSLFLDDSSTQAVFGIIDNEGSCDSINGFNRQYDVGNLSAGSYEIQIFHQNSTIKLLINGEEKYFDQECLSDVNFNKVDLTIGGEGSLRVDYSRID